MITVSIVNGKKSEYFTIYTEAKNFPIMARNHKDKESWKQSIMNARRCSLLIQRGIIALNENRIKDSAQLIVEARISEGLILNSTLIDLWNKLCKNDRLCLGMSCNLEYCTAMWFMKPITITTEEEVSKSE